MTKYLSLSLIFIRFSGFFVALLTCLGIALVVGQSQELVSGVSRWDSGIIAVVFECISSLAVGLTVIVLMGNKI